MSRIEREKQTVRKMIELYCRHRLKKDKVPEKYQHLADYACRRLDHCKYGEQKTACKDCPTHCYAPKEREQIREVMRWVGPRMILYSPKDAIIHVWEKVKRRREARHHTGTLQFQFGVEHTSYYLDIAHTFPNNPQIMAQNYEEISVISQK